MNAFLVRFGSRVILGLALWGFGCPNPAEAAEPPTVPTKKASSDAAKLFEKGVTAAKAAQWKEARDAFLAAWQLKQHWQIAANLGRAEFMLGRYREAAKHLSYFLHEAKDLGEEDRKQTEGMLAKARKKISAVSVRVNIEGADVFVDGQLAGRAPLEEPVLVDPGQRTFEARQRGYETVRTTIDVTAGSAQDVSLTLSMQGSSTCEVKTQTVREDGWQPWLIGIGAGVTVAGVATGVLSFIAAKDKRDDAALIADVLRRDVELNKEVCPNGIAIRSDGCNRYHELQNHRETLNTISIVGYVMAGVAATGTLTIALWHAGERSRPVALNVLPALTLSGGNVVIKGSF